jgi:hypothetical protein
MRNPLNWMKNNEQKQKGQPENGSHYIGKYAAHLLAFLLWDLG